MSFKAQIVSFLTGLVILLINIAVFSGAYIAMLSLNLGESQELFCGIAIAIAMLASAFWLVAKVIPRIAARIYEPHH